MTDRTGGPPKPRATHAFKDRLAVVFDFDRTLAGSSYGALLEACGYDADAFREEHVEPLSEAGWDDILAQFYTLIRETRRRDDLTVDRDFLERLGRDLEFHEGVPEMFDRVRGWVAERSESTEVEFYLLTCGFVDVHRNLPIADQFEALWGSELHFDENGEIEFIRQMITFPEKVRYLMALSKGLGPGGPNAPSDVWKDVEPEQLHVPVSQMIYVGDGGSDMPAFGLMHEEGGIAIGVFREDDPDSWRGHDEMRPDRRVEDLAPADFTEGSNLMRSLHHAVASVTELINLRRLGRGE